MSYRSEKQFILKELKQRIDSIVDLSVTSGKELRELWRKTLESGMHGLCFSLYEDGQRPGDIISREQVQRRMQIIKPYTQWIRSFSCTEGNEYIPIIAKELGIKTMVGGWLGDDPEINEREMQGLIQLANDGYVDIAAVGNEVLYRKDLSKEELLAHIIAVKEAIPDIPLGYVDAYYEFSIHEDIVDLCDVILANCYPYWEGCPFQYSLGHMQQMYGQAKAASKGKPVIISETGWPSAGGRLQGAIANEKNAMAYFINTQLWAMEEEVEIFYFSSFDESWKTGPEGDVGAFWGLWDKYEQLKFQV